MLLKGERLFRTYLTRRMDVFYLISRSLEATQPSRRTSRRSSRRLSRRSSRRPSTRSPRRPSRSSSREECLEARCDDLPLDPVTCLLCDSSCSMFAPRSLLSRRSDRESRCFARGKRAPSMRCRCPQAQRRPGARDVGVHRLTEANLYKTRHFLGNN